MAHVSVGRPFHTARCQHEFSGLFRGKQREVLERYQPRYRHGKGVGVHHYGDDDATLHVRERRLSHIELDSFDRPVGRQQPRLDLDRHGPTRRFVDHHQVNPVIV